MDAIGAYLIKLASAAIFCGIVTGLVGGDGAVGKTVKLLGTIFMMLTIISPLVQLEIRDYLGYFDEISADASDAVLTGENAALEYMAEIIKSETEAYILDKAASYGAQIQVTVGLTADSLPKPASVTVRGHFSPYAKQRLTAEIQEELGISREEQTWIAQG